MKIIELLTQNQKKDIDDLIKKYDKNNEFEISLFSNKETSSHLLTLEKFNKLNSILSIITKKNKKEYESIKTNSLDIILSVKDDIINTTKITNYRITISGSEKINEYMGMLHMRKNHLVFSVLVNFILDKELSNKDKKFINIIKKTKYFQSYITIEDLYMRIKLDEEDKLDDKEIKKLVNINKNFNIDNYSISFRYKERNSYFIEKDKNVFRLDLTRVKNSSTINKIEESAFNYEIEIECEIKDKKAVLNEAFDIGEFIIKSIQESNFIVTKSTSDYVLKNYRDLLSIDSSKTNLYGRQPVSLEIQNLVNNLPNKYAVSDKADGYRYFMLIIQNRCYLISSNLIVKDTGIEVDKKLNNSLIDGEFIFIQKYNKYLYMAFDCLYYCNENIREESLFIKRLDYLDKLLNEINKLNYKHKTVVESKINLNDIESVIKFHEKEIINFYDDIDKELNKNKFIIFRRKYFIDVLGIQDNEIFKYTSFMWNIFTKNKNLKCPYSLDGLIYHPLDQKYIIESEKSKYSEYKWKPPTKNSIDLYVEFEKNKETKKVLTVYDNSVKDELKNRPYQILNLYVGLYNKGVEKPVLFGEDLDLSQAYIYLDENKVPRSLDGKIINDKTVVEFYYNLESDVTNQYRWIPMNTRYDKTESVQKFQRRYGNAQRTANAVWRSITNPILINDFNMLSNDKMYNKYMKELRNRIDLEVIKLERKDNIYFQKKSDLVKDMAKFHHFIKSNIIYTFVNYKYNDDIQCKVLDAACGRGQDIQKFYYCEVELLVGFDPDPEALVTAVGRYQSQKKKHARYPPMYFINASATNLLEYDEQLKFLGKMNNDNKRLFNKFFSWNNNRTIFDIINCQFAIHYFLSDEISFNNFLENINKYLREGGYFIFTTFDGELVKKKLKDQENYQEFYDENGEKKLLFEIKKMYNDNSKSYYGNAIDIHMAWLFEEGVYQTEYLVNKDFIINTLSEKCNLELVETELFETMFNDCKEFLKVSSEVEEDNKRIKFFKDVYKYYEQSEINKKCYSYTFLNRYYIFRKKEYNLNEIKNKYYGKDRKRIIEKADKKTKNLKKEFNKV